MIITQEIVNKFPNCQGCLHEWSEHTNGCSHDFCNCKDKVDSSILEQVMIIKDQKVMIDVFDDFFHIRKEDKSHEYLIQAKFQGDNDHNCDSSHALVSWKFLGDYNGEIEAVFQCSKCLELFTAIYDYHGSETYEEIGIENPFLENKMIPKDQCPQGCPNCGKSDLIGQDQSQDGDYVIFPFSCSDCNFSWSEVYKFENWEKQEK